MLNIKDQDVIFGDYGMELSPRNARTENYQERPDSGIGSRPSSSTASVKDEVADIGISSRLSSCIASVMDEDKDRPSRLTGRKRNARKESPDSGIGLRPLSAINGVKEEDEVNLTKKKQSPALKSAAPKSRRQLGRCKSKPFSSSTNAEYDFKGEVCSTKSKLSPALRRFYYDPKGLTRVPESKLPGIKSIKFKGHVTTSKSKHPSSIQGTDHDSTSHVTTSKSKHPSSIQGTDHDSTSHVTTSKSKHPSPIQGTNHDSTRLTRVPESKMPGIKSIKSKGGDVVLIPLYKQTLGTKKAFFKTDLQVLDKIQNNHATDCVYVYYNTEIKGKSKLTQSLKYCAYAAICSRLPTVKERNVMSMEEVFETISKNEERKRIEKYFHNLSLGKMRVEHFEGMITKFVRRRNPENSRKNDNFGDYHSAKRLTTIQLSALIGGLNVDCNTMGPQGKNLSKMTDNEWRIVWRSRSTKYHFSVLEAVVRRPNASLAALPPLMIAIVFGHENEFNRLCMLPLSDELLERAFHSKMLTLNMRDTLLQKILRKARKHYQLDALIIASYFDSPEHMILGYDETVTNIKTGRYCGIRVELRNPKIVYSEEEVLECKSDTPMKLAPSTIMGNINKCINEHAHQLWRSHSNLNAIFAERYGNNEFQFRIILVCSSKGIIPYKEESFPKFLLYSNEHIRVRVFEGYFSLGHKRIGNPNGYNEQLCMGCDIGTDDDNTMGSLGLFIEDGELTKFITCAHIFMPFDRDKAQNGTINVYQPSLQDIHCEHSEEVRKIGTVDAGKILFQQIDQDDSSANSETSIVDAALVTVTNRFPGDGRFAVRNFLQLQKAGYSINEPPMFNSKSCLELTDMDHGKTVIKSGASTGLTRGFFNTSGLQVRTEDIHVRCKGNSTFSNVRIMKEQYEIKDMEDPFFGRGDSGSAVFLQEEKNYLSCIGIAIGNIEFGKNGRSTAVTPINAVLKSLGLSSKHIKQFNMK